MTLVHRPAYSPDKVNGSSRGALKIAIMIVVAACALLALPGISWASLSGPCEATGTIRGSTYNAKSLPDVIIVDREMSVPYSGTYTAATAGEERSYAGGSVRVAAVFGIKYTIASWGPGTTDKTTKADIYGVTFDERLPGGIEIPITGSHADTGPPCSGDAVIMIEGEGTYDAFAFLFFLILTIIFFLLMLYSGFARKEAL